MTKKITLFIDGMTCGNCEKRIEAALGGLSGVLHVKASFNQAKVQITYVEEVAREERFVSCIGRLGYRVAKGPRGSFKTIMPLLILLFAGYYLIQNTVGFNFIPQVSDGMGYGLIFIVGLLTSIHCVAMCGGIALSQSVSEQSKGKSFMAPLLYNIGRVVSYTIIGGIVGGLGSIITPTGEFKGIVAVAAGIFMLLLGLKMMNVLSFPVWLQFRLPFPSLTKMNGNNPLRPLIVGLLNGLMPCGPLQTMQLYALGTGSVAKGALSMFFFSLGTVPLLFLFGAITSVISGRLGRGMIKGSAILVMVLGIIMVNRGLSLSGMALDFNLLKSTKAEIPEIRMEDGKQIVNLTVASNAYIPDIPIVQVGVPVKLQLNVEGINGCNNPMLIPEYGIEVDFMKGDSVIEFTPTKEGPIRITCWMGMITTKLMAVGDPSKVEEQGLETEEGGSLFPGGGCSGGSCH